MESLKILYNFIQNHITMCQQFCNLTIHKDTFIFNLIQNSLCKFSTLNFSLNILEKNKNI